MKPAPEFDYSTLLASSIHEVKNSLNMLLNSVDQVVSEYNEESCPAYKTFSQIQYESKRINDDLVELLAIYRIRNNQYAANIDEYSVLDFLYENVAQHEAMILNRKINYKIECNDKLNWFFDRALLTGVISNVINNLYKYTKNKLHISAVKKESFLLIKIMDNGPGYPQDMLISNIDNQKAISFDSASTGLGLYFSRLVAELHKNKGQHGYIATTNDGLDGGGCFSIYLP